MEGLVKWLLIGGLGYVIYHELSQPGGLLSAGGGTGLPIGTQPANGVVSLPPAATGATPPPASTPPPSTWANAAMKASIISLAASNDTYKAQGGKLGFDQWNWFAQQAGATTVPNWEDTAAKNSDRSTLYTIDQYWGFIGGMSGLGRLYEARNIQKIRSGGGTNFWERRIM